MNIDVTDFYPRSPCGERPVTPMVTPPSYKYFYPRSPCGERLVSMLNGPHSKKFLSTLSLRRATVKRCQASDISVISIHALLAESDRPDAKRTSILYYFYPRSPCGERHRDIAHRKRQKNISIHALLAESDIPSSGTLRNTHISIHALLAESDNHSLNLPSKPIDFYPRSPCGERHFTDRRH